MAFISKEELYLTMFYLLVFFSIYWCSFPTEIEENSICLSYYNLPEPYSEGLFSDVYYISDVNSCRIGNVTSQMVSAFPAIEGERKGLLIKWFNNMVNIGEDDAHIVYLGTRKASRRQKFHFIYVTVSVNEKYVFLLSEFDKQVKSVILGERLNEFPMAGCIKSSLLNVTRHKCIIKFVDFAYDTNMPPESFLIKLRINNGTIIQSITACP